MKPHNCLMKYLGATALLLIALAAPLNAQAQAVPTAAAHLALELQEQLGRVPGQVSIIVTTPANLRNLNESSGLGLQLAEELAYCFVAEGYRVQEIRKGASLFFDETNGELLLTRDPEYLANTSVESSAVMVGTYIATNRSVRVNLKLIHTPNNEVLAMSSVTIPLSPEVRSLLANPLDLATMGHVPSIGTKLNPYGQQITGYDVEPGPLPPAPETKGDSTIDTFLSSFNQSPPGP